MKPRIFFLLVFVAVSSISVQAHHSIAGAYDTSRQVTIEGTISQFQFINPHPFLVIDVKQNGGVLPWRLEMDNRSELVDVGMSAQTFKAGDHIVVVGSPARAQAQSLYIRKLDRPADGFQYEQVGGSPRVRRTK